MYQTKTRKAIGIDPGLANCGYAVITRNSTGKLRLLESGCIKTDAKGSQAERLLHIYQDISEVLQENHPHLVSIERVYFNRNVSSAITTGGAIGVCLLASEQAGITSFLLTPQQAKAAATGNGRASKEMMRRVLGRLLCEDIRNHHEADAAAVAIAGLLQPNIHTKGDTR